MVTVKTYNICIVDSVVTAFIRNKEIYINVQRSARALVDADVDVGVGLVAVALSIPGNYKIT